jgi:hypothetical protein
MGQNQILKIWWYFSTYLLLSFGPSLITQHNGPLLNLLAAISSTLRLKDELKCTSTNPNLWDGLHMNDRVLMFHLSYAKHYSKLLLFLYVVLNLTFLTLSPNTTTSALYLIAKFAQCCEGLEMPTQLISTCMGWNLTTPNETSHKVADVTETTKTPCLVCINNELLVICIRYLNLHKLWWLKWLCMNCRHWTTHSITRSAVRMKAYISNSDSRTNTT